MGDIRLALLLYQSKKRKTRDITYTFLTFAMNYLLHIEIRADGFLRAGLLKLLKPPDLFYNIIMKIQLVGINAKYIHTNPAIYSLRAFALSKAPFPEITLREYTINQNEEEILRGITEDGPDVLGISCYIWNIEMIRSLLPKIHREFPNTLIFLGGPEVSYHPEKMMTEFPFLLGIMIGESEETFYEFCLLARQIDFSNPNALESSSLSHHFEKLPGFYTVSEDVIPKTDSDASSVSSRAPLSMDDIPFFYEEWGSVPALGPFEHKIIYYESSRGCPFRCAYCLSSIEKTLRFRSLEKVFSELQFFLDRKVPQVKFIDRTFNADSERSLKIWTYLRDHDNGVTNFHFEIAADILTEKEIEVLSSMRKGLVQLEIGVQSTFEKALTEINRKTDLKCLAENIALLRKNHKAHLHLDLIAGLPYETYERFQKSFNDLYEMRGDDLQLGFLKVLKGTPMEERAQQYGILYSEKAPFEVQKTNWISGDELNLLHDVEEMLELYSNSHQYDETLKKAIPLFESPFDFFLKLSEFYRKNHFKLIQSSRSYRYEALLKFLQSHDPNLTELFRETLSFDFMRREKPKKRLDFFPENAHPVPGENAYEAEFCYLFSEDVPLRVRFHYDDRDVISNNADFLIL